MKPRFTDSQRRHGMGNTRENRIWRAMKTRCNNPNAENYYKYGGRGVRVCNRWNLFCNFYADMGPCPVGFSIDRIDNDGDYKKSNCKWSSIREQSGNKRSSILVTMNGKTQCLSHWCDELNLKFHTIKQRIRKLGWDRVSALTIPVEVQR